ncbi:MAG: DUF2079 domain-containing protein, partial [Caldilineae bacterium]
MSVTFRAFRGEHLPRSARSAASTFHSFFTSDPYRGLLVIALLLYGIVFADLAFDAHAGLRTHRADLGQIDHSIWNSSRGRFLFNIKGELASTRMTDHVEPIFVLISPILWVWNDVRALLLLQVIATGVGALFLYHLTLRLLGSGVASEEPLGSGPRLLALVLGLAYLLAPQLQSAVLTEFHAIPLAVPLILWAFWAVEARRWGQFTVAALLVAGVKEEAALLAAGLGVWGLWRGGVKGWVIGRLGDWEIGRAGEWETERLGEQESEGLGKRDGMQDASISNLQSPMPNTQYPIPNAQYPISNAQYPISNTLYPILVITLSLLWFYLATFVIVPAHAAQVYDAAESIYFQRYGALGNSPLDIFKSFILRPGLVWEIATEPARVRYVVALLSAFGFLSLFGIEVLLLCLPVFLANLLSAYPAQYYGEFHYSAPLVPYFGVAAAYGMARLWRLATRLTARRSASFQHSPASGAGSMALFSLWTNAATALRPLLLIGLVLWLLAWSVAGYADAGRGPLGGRYDPTPVGAHERLLARFVAQIPPDAAVTATAAMHPHVSHRQWVYQFPLGLNAPVPATWALLDVTTNTDMAPGDLKATVDEMLAGDWGVVDAADGYLLLRRGATDKTIPDAFYDFARGAPQEKLEGASVSFGPLTLLGVEVLDWPRWRQTKLTTVWRVEEGFTPGSVGPWVEVRTPAGDAVHTLAEVAPPALVWLPPERWRPGDVIRLQSLWLFLPRTWGVVVGVEAGGRLPVLDASPVTDPSGTLALAAAF